MSIAIAGDASERRCNSSLPPQAVTSLETLRTGTGWEVRRLQPMQVVECAYEKRPEGYELLGGYVGGENALGLPMPKTAPCIMAPLQRPKTMWCGQPRLPSCSSRTGP